MLCLKWWQFPNEQQSCFRSVAITILFDKVQSKLQIVMGIVIMGLQSIDHTSISTSKLDWIASTTIRVLLNNIQMHILIPSIIAWPEIFFTYDTLSRRELMQFEKWRIGRDTMSSLINLLALLLIHLASIVIYHWIISHIQWRKRRIQHSANCTCGHSKPQQKKNQTKQWWPADGVLYR